MQEGKQIAVLSEAVSHNYRAADGAVSPVLAGIDLSIAVGEFVSILGASGSGKSTFLRLVAGLLRPSFGTITVFGSPVVGPREDVTFMFQRPTLFPWMSAIDNLLFPISFRRGIVSTKEREAAVDLLRSVGLHGKERARPFELSGGMQQRLALARALIVNPKLVLLDEPFSSLDEILRENLAIDVSQSLARARCSALLVTHSVGEAIFLSDRVMVLGGTPSTIISVIDVDLPRPRSIATFDDPRYDDLCRKLRAETRRYQLQSSVA